MEIAARPTLPPMVVDDAMLAEARELSGRIEAWLAGSPSPHEYPAPVVRKAWREGRGVFPRPVFAEHARELTIPTRGGSLALRILPPRHRDPVGIHLYLHGGGWTLAAPDLYDAELGALADATGLCVAAPDYRLAPEHPYPAGPDDCEDTALWLLERGPAAVGAPAHLSIGGDSAGGNLCAVTLLRLRDRHGITGAFAAANLVFGSFDLSGTPSQLLWGDRRLVLSGPVMRWFRDCYTPGFDTDARRDPDISPLYARLDGMPPALFSVGAADPLLDDSLFMAARWRQAGAPAELRVWPEAIHGFTAFPTRMAAAAHATIHAFLAGAAAAGGK